MIASVISRSLIDYQSQCVYYSDLLIMMMMMMMMMIMNEQWRGADAIISDLRRRTADRRSGCDRHLLHHVVRLLQTDSSAYAELSTDWTAITQQQDQTTCQATCCRVRQRLTLT